MRIEQPRPPQDGDLRSRVEYLEQYIVRLQGHLQAALNYIEKKLEGEK